MDRDREKIRIAVRDPFCRVCLPSPDLSFVVPTSARGPVHTQIALNAVVSRRIVRAGSTLRASFLRVMTSLIPRRASHRRRY